MDRFIRVDSVAWYQQRLLQHRDPVVSSKIDPGGSKTVIRLDPVIDIRPNTAGLPGLEVGVWRRMDRFIRVDSVAWYQQRLLRHRDPVVSSKIESGGSETVIRLYLKHTYGTKSSESAGARSECLTSNGPVYSC